jgi:hypothetical protein
LDRGNSVARFNTGRPVMNSQMQAVSAAKKMQDLKMVGKNWRG